MARLVSTLRRQRLFATLTLVLLVLLVGAVWLSFQFGKLGRPCVVVVNQCSSEVAELHVRFFTDSPGTHRVNALKVGEKRRVAIVVPGYDLVVSQVSWSQNHNQLVAEIGLNATRGEYVEIVIVDGGAKSQLRSY